MAKTLFDTMQIDSSRDLLLPSLGAALAYLVGLVFYRLYLHPLAKYPGPFWGKITSLYAVYHAYTGDRHILLYRMHQRHGDYVRYQPNLVSINNKAAIKELYTVGKNVQKSRLYTVFAGPVVFSLIEKKSHSIKRRVLSTAFTESALRSMEGYLLQHIRSLCDIIASKSSTPEGWVGDMGIWANYLTSDILGELSFGKEFGMLHDDENRDIPLAIETSTVMTSVEGALPTLRHSGLSHLIFPRLKRGNLKLRRIGRERAMERTAAGDTDRVDFLHYLLNAKEDLFTQSDVWAESTGLLVAGTDTTATQIAANYFYLSQNREKLNKLVSEIRVAFKSVEDIVLGHKLESCKYLNACIEETLRLSPSVPGLLPREVVNEGVNINAEYFPPGVELGVPIYALHHKSEYFEDPNSFVPERWLTGEHPPSTDPRSAFMPFSSGTRGCIGRRVAYMELQLMLAMSLFLYDIEFVASGVQILEDGKKEYKLVDHFTSHRTGPVIRFKTRKN